MNKHPIYLIDDDEEDNELIQLIWDEMGLENELVFFSNGHDLIHRLKNDPQIPFIIICDLNLPGLNGFDIRESLYNDPKTRYKTVPFIFWSNSASDVQVKKAYDLNAHGMFIKGSSINELKETFTKIIDYWQTSLKPA
jgi:CheY-like chemotaxis protein